MTPSERIDTWLSSVVERHTRSMSTPEFLKAVRALSARYVERRAVLATKSPTDSAGKRAAFSGFFAPLHFLTTRAIVGSLTAAERDVDTVMDLGCGTGAASAAWALECTHPPELVGVDRQAWALDEAAWNWCELGLRGRTRRGDLVDAVISAARPARRESRRTAVLLAWSVNEITDADRGRLLPAVIDLARTGVSVLVVEPLSREATPWWDDWVDRSRTVDARAVEWKIDRDLPTALHRISENAGFRRQFLGARSLWLPGQR